MSQDGLRNSDTSAASTINLFNKHYNELYHAEQIGTADTSIGSQNLLAEGAGLANQFCVSFFRTAGSEQQYLLFTRDIIGVVGSLTTGVLAATHASPAATASVGIASGSMLAGISAYSRNFLFSEDNVQAVEDLTLKSMATQASASIGLAKARGTNYRLSDAVLDIMSVQAVCEVQKILSLVRSSIKNSEPVATVLPGGRAVTDVPAQQALLFVGVNTTPPAMFLRQRLNSNPALVLAAIGQVAPELKIHTAIDALEWMAARTTSTEQLAAVATQLGWRGQ